MNCTQKLVREGGWLSFPNISKFSRWDCTGKEDSRERQNTSAILLKLFLLCSV